MKKRLKRWKEAEKDRKGIEELEIIEKTTARWGMLQ